MTLNTPRVLNLAAAGFALLMTTSGAHADLQICNKTSLNEIYVAIGLYRGSKGWESEGWWTVAREQCETITGELGDRYYYLYVLGDNDGVWDGTAEERKEGSTNFCVKEDDKFTLNVNAMSNGGDNPSCEKYGYVAKRFFRVDTGRYADFIFNIGD